MRKLAVFLCSALAAAAQTTTTPNVGLIVPIYGTTSWNLPLQSDFTLLDKLLSGKQALPGLTVAGTASVGGQLTVGSLFFAGGGSVLNSSSVGQPFGLAPLDGSGRVPASNLPPYPAAIPSGYSADQMLIASSSSSLGWSTIPNCPADNTHGLTYSTSTHTLVCTAIAGGPAGTANQIQTNNGSAFGATPVTADSAGNLAGITSIVAKSVQGVIDIHPFEAPNTDAMAAAFASSPGASVVVAQPDMVNTSVRANYWNGNDPPHPSFMPSGSVYRARMPSLGDYDFHFNWGQNTNTGYYSAYSQTGELDQLIGDQGGTASVSTALHDDRFNNYTPGYNYGVDNASVLGPSMQGWANNNIYNEIINDYSAGIHSFLTVNYHAAGPGDNQFFDIKSQIRPATITPSDEGPHLFMRLIQTIIPEYNGIITGGGPNNFTLTNASTTANNLPSINQWAIDTTTGVIQGTISGASGVDNTDFSTVTFTPTSGSLPAASQSCSIASSFINRLSDSSAPQPITAQITCPASVSAGQFVRINGAYQQTAKITSAGAFTPSQPQTITVNLPVSVNASDAAVSTATMCLDIPANDPAGYRYVEPVYAYLANNQIKVGFRFAGRTNSFASNGPATLYPCAEVLGTRNPATMQVDGTYAQLADNQGFAQGDSLEFTNNPADHDNTYFERYVNQNPYRDAGSGRLDFEGVGLDSIKTWVFAKLVNDDPWSETTYYGGTKSIPQLYELHGPWGTFVSYDVLPPTFASFSSCDSHLGVANLLSVSSFNNLSFTCGTNSWTLQGGGVSIFTVPGGGQPGTFTIGGTYNGNIPASFDTNGVPTFQAVNLKTVTSTGSASSSNLFGGAVAIPGSSDGDIPTVFATSGNGNLRYGHQAALQSQVNNDARTAVVFNADINGTQTNIGELGTGLEGDPTQSYYVYLYNGGWVPFYASDATATGHKYVGINNSTPTAALDVGGTLNASGAATVASISTNQSSAVGTTCAIAGYITLTVDGTGRKLAYCQ